MFGFLIRLLAIALVGFVVWQVMRPRYAVRIVIGKQGIKHHKGLPAAYETTMLEFFEKHRSFDGDVTICATRQTDGYLRLAFKGPVDEGMRQQVRNFLMTVM